MPCSDITDQVFIVLDSENRVQSYRMEKLSCGKSVGDYALLQEWLNNRSVNEIVTTSSDTLLTDLKAKNTLEEFLILKHFLAVSQALLIFSGQVPDDADYCQLTDIIYLEDKTELKAQISHKIPVANIKACKKCCSGKCKKQS